MTIKNQLLEARAILHSLFIKQSTEDFTRKLREHSCSSANCPCTRARVLLRTAVPEDDSELAELNALFDLQQTRMTEAIKLWRAGTGRHEVSPDLGDLLAWLMARGNTETKLTAVSFDPLHITREQLIAQGWKEQQIAELLKVTSQSLPPAEGASSPSNVLTSGLEAKSHTHIPTEAQKVEPAGTGEAPGCISDNDRTFLPSAATADEKLPHSQDNPAIERKGTATRLEPSLPPSVPAKAKKARGPQGGQPAPTPKT